MAGIEQIAKHLKQMQHETALFVELRRFTPAPEVNYDSEYAAVAESFVLLDLATQEMFQNDFPHLLQITPADKQESILQLRDQLRRAYEKLKHEQSITLKHLSLCAQGLHPRYDEDEPELVDANAGRQQIDESARDFANEGVGIQLYDEDEPDLTDEAVDRQLVVAGQPDLFGVHDGSQLFAADEQLDNEPESVSHDDALAQPSIQQSSQDQGQMQGSPVSQTARQTGSTASSQRLARVVGIFYDLGLLACLSVAVAGPVTFATGLSNIIGLDAVGTFLVTFFSAAAAFSVVGCAINKCLESNRTVVQSGLHTSLLDDAVVEQSAPLQGGNTRGITTTMGITIQPATDANNSQPSRPTVATAPVPLPSGNQVGQHHTININGGESAYSRLAPK